MPKRKDQTTIGTTYAIKEKLATFGTGHWSWDELLLSIIDTLEELRREGRIQ